MKRLNIISIFAACVLALPVVADSYRGVPGSSVKIAGTSTVHDWVVDSQLIGGSMELNGDLAKPGKVDAKAKALISVRSLKSGKKAMDDVMQAAMNETEHKRIEFNLKELISEGDMKFKATGDLTVSGVTKEVKFPVTMEKVDASKMKVKGELDTKMSDFGIKSPSPKIAGGMIKTGDEVKITFVWNTKKR